MMMTTTKKQDGEAVTGEPVASDAVAGEASLADAQGADPAHLSAPEAVDASDLQTRHDALALELGLIDEALTNAGFVLDAGDDTPVAFPVSHRVELALTLLASSSAALAEARTAAAESEEARAKAADALAKQPKAKKGAKPAAQRPCGPDVAVKGQDGEATGAAALFDKIAVAETVELVFSDGVHELDGVLPMQISGNAWTVANDRLMLTGVDVPIYGSSRDGQSFELAGYGLFLDGAMAAYAPRINGPLQIAPGTSHSLNGDVVFG